MLPRRTARAAALALALAVGGVACTKDDSSAEAFCDDLRKAPTLDSVVTGFADVDADELDERLDEAATAFRDLQDSAPGEVSGDVETMVELVDAVIASVKEHKDDPEAAAGELRELMADYRGAARASLNVAKYASRECDLSLNPSEATTTTEAGTGGDPSSTTDEPTTTTGG